jgi:serine/threonine protein kinase
MKVFALKRFRPTEKPLFERELRALSLLHGATGIVQEYGSFQGKETFNIIMEYATMDLQKYFMTSPQPANFEEISQIWCSLLQLLEGLSNLHNLSLDQTQYSG